MSRWLLLGAALGATTLITTADLPDAHAFASSCRYSGWTVAPGTKLPPHAHVVYYSMAGQRPPTGLTAKIGKREVPTKINYVNAGPFVLAQIEIDSDLTGTLSLAWPDAAHYDDHQVQYQVVKSIKLGDKVTGTLGRFHRAFHHSTVHESEDGLEIQLDAPAAWGTLRWRRDAKADWQDIVLGATPGARSAIRIGEVGCQANFSVPLLEQGVDLSLTVQLVDGRTVQVDGVPAHYTLPKLPRGADISTP
ncbi:MAG TPA: hypothetical protein VH025_06100 [Solirubrobacteraceae bacterium]|nr:hypothetical protein [Solirubrobacteraceae bacterium]